MLSAKDFMSSGNWEIHLFCDLRMFPPHKAIASRAVIVIVSGSSERTVENAFGALEIDENVNRAHLLTAKRCHEQSYNFRKKPKMSEHRSFTICAVVETVESPLW